LCASNFSIVKEQFQIYTEILVSGTRGNSMTEAKNLEGLGGWLILVGIGIIFAPIRIVAFMFLVYADLFSGETWALLTTPGSEAYHPLWSTILISELSINVGLVLVHIYMAFLFFSKKYSFPRFFISVLLFTLAFIFVDALVMKIILPSEPFFDPDSAREFVRTIIGALIWIPYMLRSKRVKATFVK
jgi:hypothetical protein